MSFDFIECFTTTFLRAHSWLNWVESKMSNFMLVWCTNKLSITNNTITNNTIVGIYIYKLILLVITYQHLKLWTQKFGHLMGEFDSFILIWQIKNKIKSAQPTHFFRKKLWETRYFCMVPKLSTSGQTELMCYNRRTKCKLTFDVIDKDVPNIIGKYSSVKFGLVQACTPHSKEKWHSLWIFWFVQRDRTDKRRILYRSGY